jgi:cysteine desulfurase/selenocysteine lyase
MTFDVDAIRRQFPILSRQIDGQALVYLDNAATTQKPQCVIDAIVDYYQQCNSNVHRGAHTLADESTRRFEDARDTVANFINANAREEVIWTAGTTESLNIVAAGAAQQLSASDHVMTTAIEHHANLVPWQQACKSSGATLHIAPINDKGELDLAVFKHLAETLASDLKFVTFTHISNALGTINPVVELIKIIRQYAPNAIVVVDGAQGIAHGDVDMQKLDCDFYAFSAHKVFGPTGMGVLWGKEALLSDWPVWKTGGEMISTVSYQSAQWNVLPYRFEAGTPNIAGAVGLAAALDWLSDIDTQAMIEHEQNIMAYATEKAEAFDGLCIVGNADNKVGVLSFTMDEGHSADIGFLLDRQGVAIRTGNHCAEPLMDYLQLSGTARASFSMYTSIEDIDALFTALKKVKMMLA